MKSNPYVYPYTPFANLSNSTFGNSFAEKNVLFSDIQELVDNHPTVKISFDGNTVEEKLLSIFLHDDIRFGPKEYIEEDRQEWLNKFSYFVNQKRRIEATILGFPFKMPVLLKTNRTAPDMGEVLSLKRLHDLTNIVSSIYPPGMQITIITEGVFGRFNNQTKKECDGYADYLAGLVKKLHWGDTLSLASLDEMEKLSNTFEEQFHNKLMNFTSLFLQSDKSVVEKYQGAYESLLRVVNTRDLSLDQSVLMEVYNDAKSDKEISTLAQSIRNYQKTAVQSLILNYLAYLAMRDDLNYLEKTVPGYIALTVSPKRGRLGIHPVNKDFLRLPYHGVPVLDNRAKTWSIEYLIDLKRMNKKITAMYLQNDSDTAPFYYECE